MSFHEPIPPAPIGEPPTKPSPHFTLRQPLFAAIIVVLLAAFGGAVIAHLAWTTTKSVSSGSVFGLPSGGGFNRLFPSQSGGGSITIPGGGSSTATDATASKIEPGLVDVDTVTGDGEAAGTGMVMTSDGLVITNNHVISGSTQISVYDIGNGQTYSASVVGYDRNQDVAVIQLKDASGLATVPFGDSSTLHVGSSIVTIGNAGGVGGTPSVAGGSVSALGRSITAGDSESPGDTEKLKGVIQINGSLEPGDSGGPLVSGGKVVGMDTAASSNFAFEGSAADQGFAIPIDEVLTISHRIIAGQGSNLIHIGPTALIGVYVASGNYCINDNTGLRGGGSGASGALVCGVVSGTPAASTSLAASGSNNRYDTITRLAGSPVTSAASLLSLMDTHHPGDRVALTWVDGSGASHSATISLVTGPAD
jgi:S1-C subfamily serine protease